MPGKIVNDKAPTALLFLSPSRTNGACGKPRKDEPSASHGMLNITKICHTWHLTLTRFASAIYHSIYKALHSLFCFTARHDGKHKTP